jgi:hypothetical protein
MPFVGLALILAGIVLIVIGGRRIQGPYRRYSALKEQDANVARYEAWRGGVRSDGKTGASVAMELLRRQVQRAGLLIIAGGICIFAGLVLR